MNIFYHYFLSSVLNFGLYLQVQDCDLGLSNYRGSSGVRQSLSHWSVRIRHPLWYSEFTKNQHVNPANIDAGPTSMFAGFLPHPLVKGFTLHQPYLSLSVTANKAWIVPYLKSL